MDNVGVIVKTTDTLLHRASVVTEQSVFTRFSSEYCTPSTALPVDKNTNSAVLKYTGTLWADYGGLMTLVSTQHDSIKLGKPTIVRHKASEVPLYNVNPSWLPLILALVPARLPESGNYNVDKRLIQI